MRTYNSFSYDLKVIFGIVSLIKLTIIYIPLVKRSLSIIYIIYNIVDIYKMPVHLIKKIMKTLIYENNEKFNRENYEFYDT